MGKLRVTVTHPADRPNNALTNWRLQTRPTGGGDDSWSSVGGFRAKDVTQVDIANVPAESSNDFRIFWMDSFNQETESAIVTHVTGGKPAPLEAGSFVVEDVAE